VTGHDDYSSVIENAPETKMQTTRYAVKNAQTGQLFAGFDVEGNPLWTSTVNSAKPYATELDARCQASLFRAMSIRAQHKPVTL
jgi:hypothetical protein